MSGETRTCCAALPREGYGAYARKDMSANAARLHREVEGYRSTEVPWGGEYKGIQEFAGFMGLDKPAMIEALRRTD